MCKYCNKNLEKLDTPSGVPKEEGWQKRFIDEFGIH